MATLMEDFEQQYAILSAEITTNISSLSAAGDGEKHKNIRGIERLLEEVNELVSTPQIFLPCCYYIKLVSNLTAPIVTYIFTISYYSRTAVLL